MQITQMMFCYAFQVSVDESSCGVMGPLVCHTVLVLFSFAAAYVSGHGFRDGRYKKADEYEPSPFCGLIR